LFCGCAIATTVALIGSSSPLFSFALSNVTVTLDVPFLSGETCV
jgi:hypothetical protein